MDFQKFRTEIKALKETDATFVINNQVMTIVLISDVHIVFAADAENTIIYVIDDGCFIYKVRPGEYNLESNRTFTLNVYKHIDKD